MSCITKRLADPRIYKCALEQSTEPSEFNLDTAPYSFCESTSTVLKDETERPINSLDQCFAERRQAKGNPRCQCGANCKCSPVCNC
jgi:hypothetical protein